MIRMKHEADNCYLQRLASINDHGKYVLIIYKLVRRNRLESILGYFFCLFVGLMKRAYFIERAIMNGCCVISPFLVNSKPLEEK